jgi:aldehyde dehydrogenase family 7 protein A1
MMNGRVIASERPGHSILEGKTTAVCDHLRLMLTCKSHPSQVANPLGVVSVLSAFNFPVAVYGWNFSLSFVAGNATIWKPSETTPLCAVAVTKIIAQVLEKNGIPGAVASLVTGGKYTGEAITESKDVDLGQYLSHASETPTQSLVLVSFTGSEHVGRIVGKTVQSRFGKILLELGGNNGTHSAKQISPLPFL